jgi:signal transduction histidine kinase
VLLRRGFVARLACSAGATRLRLAPARSAKFLRRKRFNLITSRSRLLRTSGFRIAVLYLLLLSVTLFTLTAFVYWSTTGLVDRQMKETVEAEIRGLADVYRDEGLPRLVEAIGERSGPGGDPKDVYLLIDSEQEWLAGNLETWPEGRMGSDGWLEVRLEQSGDDPDSPHLVRGRVFDLEGGYRLFVGHDTNEQDDFRDILLRALGWGLPPALLFGLVGGALIGRYSLRRVDAVRTTGEEIINGDLSRRVPLSGSGDEFDRLAATINEMLDRIDTLMSGMRLVTDSLAHDLRSPLTRAKSGIELALRQDLDAQAYKHALEQTGSELETILHTFGSLINIARAEAGVNRLALNSLDLSALLGDLIEVYQPIAENAGLCMISEIAPETVIVGHRQLLGQAVANLLDNAIKFTPAGGQIHVSLKRDGAPQLTVRDCGPGIPSAERDRVLQRFVRLDNSRGMPGSGLGLSLVAAVAKLHGARLELGDNGPGLRVTLQFPDR